MNKKLVILPVYNEESTVDQVLDAVRQHHKGDVLVIDDGSSDGTTTILASRSDIEVIHLNNNRGYGCALRLGFDVAVEFGYSSVVTMDCDGQHEPSYINLLFEAVETGQADIVSGSRYLPGSAVIGSAPDSRREVNETITREINAVTGWNLTDAFCGFKAYKTSALSSIAIHDCGYGMPLELFAQAYLAGLSVVEVPVPRIYINQDRTFGAELDNPKTRLEYYLRVWARSLKESK